MKPQFASQQRLQNFKTKASGILRDICIFGTLLLLLSSGIVLSLAFAEAPPNILPPDENVCNMGLMGTCDQEGQITQVGNVSGPESVLQHWLFSTAVPWWISFFLILASGVAVLMIMIGGILITTSGENTDRRSKGIKTIVWALVGLLIAVFAFTIIAILENLPLPGSTGEN